MKKVISIALILVSLVSILSCSFAAVAAEPEALPLDGTVISGQTTKDNHYNTYAFTLEQRGAVTFTFLADKNVRLITLKNEDTGDEKTAITFTGTDFKDNWTCQRASTLYLQQGNYTLEVYGAQTEYKVKAEYKPYTEKISGYLLSANKTANYLFDEWSTPKSHRIIVKKPYRLIYTVTHNMPVAINVKAADGTVYSATAKYKAGTAAEPATDTIVLNLPKGTYSLNLRALNNAENACECGGIYSINVQVKPFIKTPADFKVITRKTDRQTVSYKALKGVDGYQVQCSDGGTKWDQTKSGTSLTCSFKGLTPGGKYKFRVRSYVIENGKKYYSAWSEVLNSACTPEKAQVKKASSDKSGQLTVQWAKNKGTCTGYEVCLSNDRSFKNIEKTVKVTADSKALQSCTTKFPANRMCFAKVRAYTRFGGKTYYGAWSLYVSTYVK